VDEVWFERAKAVGEQAPVSPQRKVVLLPPINREGHRTSLEIESSDGTDCAGARRLACPDTEEREIIVSGI